MEQLLIATGNPGKFMEIRAGLEGLPYEILSLLDLDSQPGQVEEDGDTHEANALLKARHFGKHTGLMTLGEDSGIQIDALRGELGLHTRRWGAGVEASDEQWLNYFLERMREVPEKERGARFVCVAVLRLPNGREEKFYGEAEGFITHEPEAPILPGLPLSSVFKMQGHEKVYAAMSKEEKLKVSHRGWAVAELKRFLSE